jgi:hypothetical protein
MILRRAGYPPSGGTKFGIILLQLFRTTLVKCGFHPHGGRLLLPTVSYVDHLCPVVS